MDENTIKYNNAYANIPWLQGLITLYTLMKFPIHIDTISVGLPIVYLKGSQVVVSK